MEKKLFDFMNEVKATRNGNRGGKSPLQDLHDAFGFDFNKPIICEKKNGSFTPCALGKEYGFNLYDYVAVVAIKDGCYYKIVRLYPDKAEIDFYGMNWFNAFWTKQEYNDRRKNPWFGDTYVIAQKEAYVTTKTPTNRASICERYVQISRFNIQIKGVKNSRIYGVDLDKSGYPVEIKRELLEARTRKLKEEKNVERYKAMANTQDMISRAKKAIEAKKIELSKRILDVVDRKTADDFKASVYYLRDCYFDIEWIEKQDARKEFDSPEEFNKSIGSIYTKLDRI